MSPTIKDPNTKKQVSLLSEETRLLIEHGDASQEKYRFILQLLVVVLTFVLGYISAASLSVITTSGAANETAKANNNLLISISIGLAIPLFGLLFIVMYVYNKLDRYYKLRFNIINLAIQNKENLEKDANKKLRDFLEKS